MVLASRRGGGTGRFLEWKIRLFFVAAVFLLVGMARNLRPLVAVAIVLLGAAFLLRFFEQEPPAAGDGKDEEATG